MTKEKVPFEKALRQLEEIVGKLESGDLTLDSALEYFERGIGLMRACDAHLKGAEGRIRELLKGENGEFIEKVLGMTAETALGGDDDDE
jgi:exodeoxyribonuclease VII small subunit